MSEELSNINSNSTSRRDFLKISTSAVAAAGVAGTIGGVSSAHADDFYVDDFDASTESGSRRIDALAIRVNAAERESNFTLSLGPQLDNDDEARYKDQRYYASYSKSLPCNSLGEVNPGEFKKLQLAMQTGAQEDFNAIVLATDARPLTSPQAAFKYILAGRDSHSTRINSAHAFRSAEIAVEMGEVYWQAVLRDVPFMDYGNRPIVQSAVNDLNSFTARPSQKPVTVGNLFRGETAGDLKGPYVSQLLLLPFSYGSVDVEQRYEVGTANVDFMLTEGNWLAVQRGRVNETATFETQKKFIYNARSMAEYVHRDITFSAYIQAALIMMQFGQDALDSGFPYGNTIFNQQGFTTFGAPFILDLVARAGNLGLATAWFHKWRVNRFLRPEAYAGRVHFHVTGQANYELHDDILNSNVLSILFNQNGTYFCPQAFPEGSPTHPSFPAGHACYSGACATVLKALFNEDFLFPRIMQSADGLTLNDVSSQFSEGVTFGGEINKLANNIALGRDGAGVHYRQDGIQGLYAGEQVAIALLQQEATTVNEDFPGFSLTTFKGHKITIKKDGVFNDDNTEYNPIYLD